MSFFAATGAERDLAELCVGRRWFADLFEVLQVGRRLVLARRHQQAVGAKEIVLASNLDMLVPFGAN